MALILIIDDDVQIRLLLKRILEQDGHEVMDISDGKEGLKIYRERPADLIITDIIMPEKDGLEIIQDFRQEFPDVKIIAISGGGQVGSDVYLNAARCFGAKYTFTKPIEREELLTSIQESLKKV